MLFAVSVSGRKDSGKTNVESCKNRRKSLFISSSNRQDVYSKPLTRLALNINSREKSASFSVEDSNKFERKCQAIFFSVQHWSYSFISKFVKKKILTALIETIMCSETIKVIA